MVFIWDFEKLQHITGNPEVHIYGQGCAHAQERPEKDISSGFWLNWRLCTIGSESKLITVNYLYEY